MAITDEQVREFESKYKSKLFGMINEFSDEQAKLIGNIRETAQYANIDRNLPNIGITMNNKIIELSHEFARAGISMFSERTENYGPFELDFVGPSFIGEALINNMMEKVNEATQVLGQYDSALQEMMDKRQLKAQQLRRSGPIKRAFLALRGWIMPTKKIDLSYTREEKQLLDSFLSEYSGMDQEIWNYTLRDNVIPSLVQHIKKEYDKEDIQQLLEETVIPNLEKLRLADLVPELKEQLKKAFEQEKLSTGKLGELSPELRRDIQQGQVEIAKTHAENLNTTQFNPGEVQTSIEEQE